MKICENGVIREMTDLEVSELKNNISEPTVAEQIQSIKSELFATDYRVIKCFEYSLIGLEMPYPIDELCGMRQSLRDEINRLEELCDD